MPLTMMEAAKHHRDHVEAGVAKIITENVPFLDKLPWMTIQGGAYRYNRERSLGGIAYRGIGGTYTADTGIINPESEHLAWAGGEIIIDAIERETMSNLIDLEASKYEMKARSMGFFFSEQFIEGDTAVNPFGIDGIRKRAVGNQVIGTSGGATLTLSQLDQLLDLVVGEADCLIMNKTLRRKVTDLARAQTGTARIQETRDNFNRQYVAYAGVPIWVIERDDDASTFLDFDEDDTGAGGNLDTSSIYACRFGMNYLHGICKTSVPRVHKVTNEMESRNASLGRIEWGFGLVIKHPRSIARLRFINNA